MPFRDFSPFFATFSAFSRGRDRDVATGAGIKKRKEEAAACEKETDDGELMNVIIACIGGNSRPLWLFVHSVLRWPEGRTLWQGKAANSPKADSSLRELASLRAQI